MGFLHAGHLSLVEAARRDNDHVVTSIFVNPAQFAANEDLDRYPRDEPRDLAMLEAAGVDVVFAPTVEEVYPTSFATYVAVEGLTTRLEGASRPAHFRGVTTVVLKLLNIVQPERAYFGQKDAQQLAVIRRMVRDLNVPIEVVALPIVREADGLAMSSRNVYLTSEQRAAALALSASLRRAQQSYAAGERDAGAIRAQIEAQIAANPLANIDYVSVADPDTLEEITTITGAALVSLAVRFETTRLIDNVVLAAE